MIGAVLGGGVWTVTKQLQLAAPAKARIPLHVAHNGPVTIDVTVSHATHSETGGVGSVSLVGPSAAVHPPWQIRMADQMPHGDSHFAFHHGDDG